MDERDRISYLPEVVIYNVMDFLPTKEVVRTSILSKRWQHVRASYPSLDFDQTFFGRELAIQTTQSGNLVERCPDLEEKRDNFIKFVDENLLRFHEQGLRIRTFKLNFTISESTMVSLVDRWIGCAMESRVEELHLQIISPHDALYKLPQTVFATRSIKALKLQNIELEQLLHRSIRFYSLQKLSLSTVHVDALVIAHIISSCPLMEEIELIKCLGLHKVHISGLHNLKIVAIVQGDGGIETHIEAPSLQKLRYAYADSNYKFCPNNFNLIACQNLKELSLIGIRISDQQFVDLLSKLPLLEVLCVVDCRLLKSVKIPNQHLQRLALMCIGLQKAEIDAPKLKSLHAHVKVIPVITSRSPSAQWKVNIILDASYCMNSQSFCKLRNLVAQSENLKSLTLMIRCGISFTVEEIKDFLLPSARVVDHIELELRSSSEGYSALLDGLLWSCHPKILSIGFGDVESRSVFIRVLREKIVHKLDLDLNLLESIQGWQYDMKDVEFHDGDGRPLNWSALSDVTPNSQGRPKLHATFKW